MEILTFWMDPFDNYIDSMAAQHTTNWPLMVSASRMLLVPIGYVFLVTWIGPKFMEKRKPYTLKRIIIAYNILQVVSCAILVTWIIQLKPSWGCVSLQDIVADDLNVTARVCWWTMLLKMAELVETVFFVLRKKQNQVSALHVYHHTSTLIIVWGAAKLFPSTMVLIPVLLNSFVHFLMYTYYLLSAVGPEVQQKINRWKKYITIIQMIQFCILLGFTAQILLPYCPVPNGFAYIFIPNVFLVFYMFYQFYDQAYSNRAQKKL